MKMKSILALASSLLVLSCGASSTKSDDTVTPSLPFTEIAATFPLTTSPLASSLIFANDIDPTYVDTLKADLAVMDGWNGLMTDSEKTNLVKLIGIADPNTANLIVWFKERLKYILSSDLSHYQLGLVFGPKGEVGLQTLGTSDESDDANTGGGNIGTAIYLTTLSEQKTRSDLTYLILRINDKWIQVLSPQVGLMRIGPAMFSSDYQVNHTNIRALSNSLQRLEVLFHEARHSDGNSAAGSVGFPHINCPNDGTVAAELVGQPACDNVANGAYAVGAAVLKPLLHLCDARCSTGEKQVLQAVLLDRLSRVSAGAKTLDPTPETGFNSINIGDFSAFALR